MATVSRFRDEVRRQAAQNANAEDAAVWRWFSNACDEGLIRWRKTHKGWLVTVNHENVAIARTFDQSVREAMSRSAESAMLRKEEFSSGEGDRSGRRRSSARRRSD